MLDSSAYLCLWVYVCACVHIVFVNMESAAAILTFRSFVTDESGSRKRWGKHSPRYSMHPARYPKHIELEFVVRYRKQNQTWSKGTDLMTLGSGISEGLSKSIRLIISSMGSRSDGGSLWTLNTKDSASKYLATCISRSYHSNTSWTTSRWRDIWQGMRCTSNIGSNGLYRSLLPIYQYYLYRQ